MLQWIGDNAGTLLISAALAGLVALIIVRMRKDRKQGKSTCGCGCGSCPMSGTCHKQS